MNSIDSPFGRLAEQSEPRVPHAIPAAEMVPSSGFVIVNSWPEAGATRPEKIVAADDAGDDHQQADRQCRPPVSRPERFVSLPCPGAAVALRRAVRSASSAVHRRPTGPDTTSRRTATRTSVGATMIVGGATIFDDTCRHRRTRRLSLTRW